VRPLRATARAEDTGPLASFAAIQADLREFQRRNGLKDVVVLNVATTEPLPETRPSGSRSVALRAALDDDRAEVFPPSLLYGTRPWTRDTRK